MYREKPYPSDSNLHDLSIFNSLTFLKQCLETNAICYILISISLLSVIIKKEFVLEYYASDSKVIG